MVKHIVMWNVRGETPEQKKESAVLVKTAFESLSGKIPGLTRLEVGLDVSAVDYACDVVLYTEFESQESLDAYASHPEHPGARPMPMLSAAAPPGPPTHTSTTVAAPARETTAAKSQSPGRAPGTARSQ